MIYTKPKFLRLAEAISAIRGIDGKPFFFFLDLDVLSPFYLTCTAGTVGAYESDE